MEHRREPLSFEHLRDLTFLLEQILDTAMDSISMYRDAQSGGFTHLLARPKEAGKFSKASTATCLTFLHAAGEWRDSWASYSNYLRDEIVQSRWGSSGLPDDNPFTISFLLEALHVLCESDTELEDAQCVVVAEKINRLHSALESGGIGIAPYPPTAFLTYKAVNALKLWNAFTAETRASVLNWAWATLHEESILVASESPNSDVFELAYATITITAAMRLQDMTPPQRDTIGYVLGQFFSAQTRQGDWPRSRPLFLYPTLGNAYCYAYELLSHMLEDNQLWTFLQRWLPALDTAARALERDRFPLDREAWGWSSGHLRQVQSAESWATASVFHYCHLLRSLVGDAIRRQVFEYVGEPTPAVETRSTSRELPDSEIDTSRFLDSDIELDNGEIMSLTSVLVDRFLRPLRNAVPNVIKGQPFPKGVPLSAIFFGPPGTSKTQLASIIAGTLGWPLLQIDPSHLTRNGLDRLHAETFRLFTMLGATERLVLLLDEFDELVREREGPNEALSRFLTTAMLPKIAALRDRRRLVFLLATNHVEVFDSAIARPGRFDMILPVMPPNLKSKLLRWTEVADRAEKLGIDFSKSADVGATLADLTFAEFSAIALPLTNAVDRHDFHNIAEAAKKRCTLEAVGNDSKNWRTRIREQRWRIRLPE